MKQLIRIEKADQGFSLVTVLLLVALLTIVLVAFGALLNISLTSSGNTELRAQARQNAVAAMGMAIGELQRTLGPDQRISAPSSILDPQPNSTTDISTRLNQPNWTGVWKSVRVDGTSPIWSGSDLPTNYYDKDGNNIPTGFKGSGTAFVRWLVSVPENANQTIDGASPAFSSTDINLPRLAPTTSDSSSVVLVDVNTTGSNTGLTNPQVRAWKIKGDTDQAGRTGYYAWWVGDEGIKAKINLLSGTAFSGTVLSTSQQQALLASAPRTALEAVSGYDSLAATDQDLNKTATWGSVAMAYKNGNTPSNFIKDKGFYDFTVYSKGVFSDLQKGGLKKDLNLLLELPQTSLPSFVCNSGSATYPFRLIYSRYYSGTNMGPDWGLVYRYYNLYKSPYLYKDTDGAYAFYMDRYNADTKQQGERDFIVPQTLRMQYLFGFFHKNGDTFEAAGARTTSVTLPDGSTGQQQTDQLYLGCYPAVYLWNPYNIRIRTSNPSEVGMSHPAITGSEKISAHIWSFPGGALSINVNGGGWRPLIGTSSTNSIFQPYQTSMSTLWLLHGDTSFLPVTWDPGSVRVFGMQTGLSTSQLYWQDHNPTSVQPSRAFNLKYGFNSSSGPAYSNLLTMQSDPRVYNPSGAINFQIKFNTDAPSLTASPLGGSLFYEGEATSSGTFPNGPSRIVGIQDFSTQYRQGGATTDTSISYKTLTSPGDIPAVTAGNGASRTAMAFSYSINYKVYPSDFQRKIKFSLFTDPLEKSYIILGGDAASAQMAPFEITVTPIKGSADNVQQIVYASGADVGVQAIQASDSSYTTGYFGAQGDTVSSNVVVDFPTIPLNSLIQLQNVALGRDYTYPMYMVSNIYGGYDSYSKAQMDPQGATFFRALGNSYAHPMIPSYSLTGVSPYGRSFDHSFYANNAFFDSYFFSGIAPEIPINNTSPINTGVTSRTESRSAAQVLKDFLKRSPTLHKSLMAQRMLPWVSPSYQYNVSDSDTDLNNNPIVSSLFNGSTIRSKAYSRSASWLMVDGAFNVNSTSVDAWVAILSGNINQQAPYMPSPMSGSSFPLSPTSISSSNPFISFLRLTLPNSISVEASGGGLNQNYWNGFRSLTVRQIQEVATELVKQIKRRGPFLSLAEFVNRQICADNTSNTNQSGALQAAIDAQTANYGDGINNGNALISYTLNSGDVDSALPNKAAAVGAMNTGITGFVTQADLLKPIVNTLSARSDTFIIRSYGEVSQHGTVLSRAWCEAVVHRTPEFVDQTDRALSAQDTDGQMIGDAAAITSLQSNINKQFGRRFRVIQFRWLTPDEI